MYMYTLSFISVYLSIQLIQIQSKHIILAFCTLADNFKLMSHKKTQYKSYSFLDEPVFYDYCFAFRYQMRQEIKILQEIYQHIPASKTQKKCWRQYEAKPHFWNPSGFHRLNMFYDGMG